MVDVTMEKNYRRDQSTLFIYVNYSEFVTNLGCQLITHVESFIKRHKYANLIKELYTIDANFKKQLNYLVDYKQSQKYYMWIVWGYFLLILLLLACSSLIYSPGYNLDHFEVLCGSILYLCVMLVVRLRILQINMFIRYFGDLQAHLNCVLVKQQQANGWYGKRVNCNGSLLFECNHIYTHIWHLTNIFGDCFGWSMVGTCIQSLVDIMNAIYWSFINMDTINSDEFTISKIICFRFCVHKYFIIFYLPLSQTLYFILYQLYLRLYWSVSRRNALRNWYFIFVIYFTELMDNLTQFSRVNEHHFYYTKSSVWMTDPKQLLEIFP